MNKDKRKQVMKVRKNMVKESKNGQDREGGEEKMGKRGSERN